MYKGLAASINPIQLQTFFRNQAPNVLLELENNPLLLASFTDQYQNLIRRSDLVDSSIIRHIWPQELRDFRICIVSFNACLVATSVITYTPSNSPKFNPVFGTWTGNDIVLRLHKNHFTLMNFSGTGVYLALPIDRLIEYATKQHIFIDQYVMTTRGSIHESLYLLYNSLA